MLSADAALKASFVLNTSVTNAHKELLDYDPDLLSSTDSSLGVIVVDIEEDKLTNPDFDNMSAFSFAEIAGGVVGSNNKVTTFLAGNAALTIVDADIDKLSQVRRLTQRVSAAEAATSEAAVRFVIIGTQATLATPNGIAAGTEGTVMGVLSLGTAA